ncbi:Core-binding factor subunit beta [Willisornis vidua]|uniref:Core-binding factor subunit beta n=1 Tax=Willisornis vidua TaxID=1566151 RepID=A0ABQ9CUJ3_9PASS|nr:Core-binding factor subunit beta [Willisornis vidua]
MIRGWRISPMKTGCELGLFSLKKRFQGDIIEAFQYLKRAYKKDGDKRFSRACCNRTREFRGTHKHRPCLPPAELPLIYVDCLAGGQQLWPNRIKYTGFRDRPHEERQARFQNACRDGRSEIAFVATGTNLSLQFFPASWQGEQRQTPTREYVDFEREGGKVYLKAPMILNGVCVIWKGWIDLQRLDGMGCLEFDEERAQQEDALAQQAFEEARRRTREFEDRDRSHREEMEARRQQDPSPGSNLGSGDDLKLR